MKSDRIFRILSYVLVMLVTAVLTACAMLVLLRPTKLEQLESLILDRFIGEADQTAIEDAAADAMVNALGDRWSYYVPAEDYQALYEQQQNAYVGIGVTITQLEDASGLEIVQVTAGGPAEEAGVLAGDVILVVSGQSIAGMETGEIQNRIRGEAGTTVELTLLRGGEEITLSVERRQIRTVVATAELLDHNIGLVTIVNFNANCETETRAAIETLLEQGAQALIFDVRYNPGGRADELVRVLDYLLPEGTIFTSVYYTGQETVDYSDAACLDIPMAVLVNADSYSAAEFFAAALSEYDAAVVVGEKTSGKGYFQTVYTLSDGSALGLSIGKYYTPKGISLDGVGVTPDIPVPVDEQTAAAIYAGTLEPEDDPQLQAAVQALLDKQTQKLPEMP